MNAETTQKPALAHAPRVSPSVAKVIHSSNPKKNPYVRRTRQESPDYGGVPVLRMSGASKRALRPTKYVDGSIRDQVKSSVSPSEVAGLLSVARKLPLAPSSVAKLARAATTRMIQLTTARPCGQWPLENVVEAWDSGGNA